MPQNPTTTVRSTVTLSSTAGQLTSFWTTTASFTAFCHYPTAGGGAPPPPMVTSRLTSDPAPTPTASRPPWCNTNNCEPWWGGGKGGGWGWRTRGSAGIAVEPTAAAVAKEKRFQAVADITSTITATPPITRTVTTTVAGRTVTEIGKSESRGRY